MKKINFKKPNIKKPSKEEIKESFKTKHFKRGSYSAGVVVIVLAIVIVLNLVISQLPTTITSIDISDNDYYTLSSKTNSVLDSLEQDITIYQIVTAGNEDAITTKLLQKYEETSDHIQVEAIDPELNPTFTQTYDVTDLEDNSLIVVSDLRYKVVNASDIYEYTYDTSYYTTGTYSSADYDGEGEITSAIDYVITDELPILYTLYGNGEMELSTTITDAIKKENFEISELSLIETGEIPEDCDVLAIIAPTNDLSQEEANKIISYLQAGGCAFIVSSYTGTEMPNFNAVLEAYGMQVVDGFVVEGDSNYYYSNQLYLLPEIESHDVTDPINTQQLYIMAPYSQGITNLDSVRSTLNFTDLLTTTDDSYSLADYGESGSITKSENDIDGPFSICKAVTEEVEGGTSKVVLLTSYYVLTDEVTQYTPANISLLTNTLNWMCEHESKISIDAKSLDVEYNTISDAAANTWTAITTVIIPVAIIIIGLTVWIRRKKA